MSSNFKKEELLAGIVHSRYAILRTLYPGEEINLSELAERMSVDKGNLSRYVTELEEQDLVWTRSVVRGRGKPFRLIGLSPVGRDILKSYVDVILTKNLPEVVDGIDITFYLNLLEDSDDPEVQRLAMEEIVLHFQKLPDAGSSEILSFLRMRILDPSFQHLRLYMLQVLKNILHNADDQAVGLLDDDFREPLVKLSLNPLEPSDRNFRIQYDAFEVLAQLIKGQEGYVWMMTAYMELLSSGSSIALNVRELILSKYPEKKNEMKMELFKMFANSNSKLRAIIEGHITQLR